MATTFKSVKIRFGWNPFPFLSFPFLFYFFSLTATTSSYRRSLTQRDIYESNKWNENFYIFLVNEGTREKRRWFLEEGSIFAFSFFLSNLSFPRLIDHKKRPFPVLDRDLDVISRERETRRRSFREALSFRIKTKGRKENFDRGWKQRRNAGEYYESFFRAESRKSLSNPDVLRIKGWPTFLALLKTASPFHPFFEKFPRCFSTYLSELELGGRASFFFFITARHIWL